MHMPESRGALAKIIEGGASQMPRDPINPGLAEAQLLLEIICGPGAPCSL